MNCTRTEPWQGIYWHICPNNVRLHHTKGCFKKNLKKWYPNNSQHHSLTMTGKFTIRKLMADNADQMSLRHQDTRKEEQDWQAQEKRLHRFLSSKLSNEADAQDFAQEAFLRLLRIENKKLIQNPDAYLMRIARNLLYEHYVNIPSQPKSSEGLDWEDAGDNVEEQVIQSQSNKELEWALGQLPAKCRAVLVLHRRDGLTYEQIAQTLEISTSMVKKYIIQGLSKCRSLLR